MKSHRKIKRFDLARITQIDQIEDYAEKVFRAAKLYCELGWYVIPLEPGQKALAYKGVHYTMASRNLKTITGWFDPGTGKYPGHNIGIATGRANGIFALDVDCKEGEPNGFESLEELLRTDGVVMPSCPTQESPTGGKHFLFQWQESAASSTGKLGPSLDTRGGEADACKAHIVAWPSIIRNKHYKWLEGGQIPPIPSFITKRLGVAWTNKMQQGEGRGLEMAEDPDFEQQVPQSQIRRMLASIDPNTLSYDEWLRVGMAVHSQHPGEDGLDLWNTWSESGERYKAGECGKRWEGLPDMGKVRIATLFYFARKAGHTPEPQDVNPNSLALVTERMNEKNAVVMLGGKIRVLHELEGEMSLMDNRFHLLSVFDFKILYSNDTVLVGTERPKAMSVADIWLADVNRRQYTKGVGLFPQGEPQGYYNTWQGFQTSPEAGDCTLWLDHLENVLCHGNDQYYEYLLDWCADLFQHPAQPKGVAIVARGGEGSGKGTFGNTLCYMCAPHSTHLIDEEHLTGKFNSHLAQSIVCFADEITWGGHKKTAGKLKGLVTERFLVLERKGIDAVAHENMIHLVVASNNEWVIPAGMDSRRWFVLDVSDKRKGDMEYFQSIYNELDNGGREAFLQMMLARKITHNLSVAPVTRALDEQRSLTAVNEDQIGTWWRGMIQQRTIPLRENDTPDGWPEWCWKYDIYQAYERWCMDRRKPLGSDNHFYKRMVEFGMKPRRKRHMKTKVHYFGMPTIEEATKIYKLRTGMDVDSNLSNEDENNEDES